MFEELLVPEINAAFCCTSLGTISTVRRADYIGSWLKLLREDNRAIIRAASLAASIHQKSRFGSRHHQLNS